MPISIDPDELFAILHALYWALLAAVIGAAIVGTMYWTSTLKDEQRAGKNRHFGGV